MFLSELETRLGPFVEKTLPMLRRLGGVKWNKSVKVFTQKPVERQTHA